LNSSSLSSSKSGEIQSSFHLPRHSRLARLFRDRHEPDEGFAVVGDHDIFARERALDKAGKRRASARL
jgi:hypothetical protein